MLFTSYHRITANHFNVHTPSALPSIKIPQKWFITFLDVALHLPTRKAYTGFLRSWTNNTTSVQRLVLSSRRWEEAAWLQLKGRHVTLEKLSIPVVCS